MTLPVRYVQRVRDDEPRSWIDLMTPAVELAKSVANTDFVPRGMRGNPAAITAAILYGDEVGLGPMQSLARISVIEGRPTLASETQRALILAAGHQLWIEDATTTRVTVAGRRRDSDETVRVTWTLDDAKRAGIDKRHNWRAYPRQMLTARATAELARMIFADAIGGLAASEEFDSDREDAPSNPVATAPPAPTTRRRRARTSPSVATSSAPTDPPAPEAPAVPGDDAPKTDPVADAIADETIAAPGDGGDVTPADTPPDDAEPTGDDRPLTEPMARRLDAIVGNLRDRGGHITTDQLYYAIGTLRRQTPSEIVAAVGGLGEDGQIHWAPLRDSLTRGEARQLSEWFEAKEQRIREAAEAPPVPGDEQS